MAATAATPETFPGLLPVREAAEAARVSAPTMYRLVQRGEVPGAVRVGTAIRLREDVFRAWLLGGRP